MRRSNYFNYSEYRVVISFVMAVFLNSYINEPCIYFKPLGCKFVLFLLPTKIITINGNQYSQTISNSIQKFFLPLLQKQILPKLCRFCRRECTIRCERNASCHEPYARVHAQPLHFRRCTQLDRIGHRSERIVESQMRRNVRYPRSQPCRRTLNYGLGARCAYLMYFQSDHPLPRASPSSFYTETRR